MTGVALAKCMGGRFCSHAPGVCTADAGYLANLKLNQLQDLERAEWVEQAVARLVSMGAGLLAARGVVAAALDDWLTSECVEFGDVDFEWTAFAARQFADELAGQIEADLADAPE